MKVRIIVYDKSYISAKWKCLSFRKKQKCDAIKQNESEVENFWVFFFLAFSIMVLFKLYVGENPMVIGQLVLEK